MKPSQGTKAVQLSAPGSMTTPCLDGLKVMSVMFIMCATREEQRSEKGEVHVEVLDSQPAEPKSDLSAREEQTHR